MTESKTSPNGSGLSRVQECLDRLHAEAEANDGPVLGRFLEEAEARHATTEAELADVLSEAFIPIDPECGRLLHVLARSRKPGRIVEFGTSMGISAIYLASALRSTDLPVITTELASNKVARAEGNFQDAGLGGMIDLRAGDAFETLADLDEPVSLLYLDGWKDLYLPMLKLIEPLLVDGAIVMADDTLLFADACEPLLGYLRNHESGYESAALAIGDGVEIACRFRERGRPARKR